MPTLQPFLRNGLLSCLVHDWGKANSGFAAMLARIGDQTARHEVVSALIMTQPRVWHGWNPPKGWTCHSCSPWWPGIISRRPSRRDYADAREFGAKAGRVARTPISP